MMSGLPDNLSEMGFMSHKTTCQVTQCSSQMSSWGFSPEIGEEKWILTSPIWAE